MQISNAVLFVYNAQLVLMSKSKRAGQTYASAVTDTSLKADEGEHLHVSVLFETTISFFFQFLYLHILGITRCLVCFLPFQFMTVLTLHYLVSPIKLL